MYTTCTSLTHAKRVVAFIQSVQQLLFHHCFGGVFRQHQLIETRVGTGQHFRDVVVSRRATNLQTGVKPVQGNTRGARDEPQHSTTIVDSHLQ